MRGARLPLSPKLTGNQRPGPLPHFHPMAITGEGEASAGPAHLSSGVRGEGTALPLPHLGLLRPPGLHSSLPDWLNLGLEIRNSSDSAER